jgi:hypothetical protein
MTVLRPCRCDNFVPGQPYVAGRDCHKCWMFAHRRAVRKAWGGNPDDCDALFAARPSMPANDLADLLAGPVVFMPDDWRHWPVSREAHLLLVERFLADLPPYLEGRFAGRGAVICGGGAYEPGAYVACRMLRHVGWTHPIQVWHRGAAEPVSVRLRNLPGVEVVDTEAHPARPDRRTMGGWQSKIFAVTHCPFEEVLFLDADCYPIADPNECFTAENNPHGIVVWPDGPPNDLSLQWATYDLTPDGKAGINGGHYVFTKRKAWRVLQLAGHYDNHSDYYYCLTPFCRGDLGGFGDQDQVRAALRRLGAPSHRYTDRPLALAFDSYLQAGPHGRLMFVHRHHNKFALPGYFEGQPRWHGGGLPLEAVAWRYFLDWVLEPTDLPTFPEEVPGSLTRAECDLWSRSCRDREVLERGREHGRSTIVAAHSARKVVSIDPGSALPTDFQLQRQGLRHKVRLCRGSFAEVAPRVGGPFSACLLNAGHDRPSFAPDMALAVSLLGPGAVIGVPAYDDPQHPDVRAVVDESAQRYGWKLVGRADFLAVFVTPGERETRP